MAGARMPDGFFKLAAHHLPPEQPVGPAGGRPGIEHRLVLKVLWFVLATGCRWEDVPPELGCSGRTAHRCLRRWEETGRLGPPARRPAAAAAPGRQAGPRPGHRRCRHGAGLRRRRGDRPQPRGPQEKGHETHAAGGPARGAAGHPHGRGQRQRPPADHPAGAGLPEGRRASRAGPRSCPTSCTPTGATTATRPGGCWPGWASSRTSPGGGRRTAAGWGRSAGWWSGPSVGSRGCGGCGSATTAWPSSRTPGTRWRPASSAYRLLHDELRSE